MGRRIPSLRHGEAPQEEAEADLGHAPSNSTPKGKIFIFHFFCIFCNFFGVGFVIYKAK